jgi:5-methyltetrahydropteroyltriglutamate--homocysteine methyltransferase
MVGRLKDVVDVQLPTTHVGLYPRPTWYNFNIRDRGWIDVCSERPFLELYTDAVTSVIADQEVAGLDIITDGCVRYDSNTDRGVASWEGNNIAYMGGVKKVQGRPEGNTLIESIIGTKNAKAAEKVMGHSEESRAWWWLVEDEMSEGNLGIWLDTAKVALGRARKPLKFSGPSAAMAAYDTINRTRKNDRDVYFQLFKVQNRILREIADAGCKIIQIDYPFALTHWSAQFNKVSSDIWKDLVDAANEEIKGVNAHIWYHFCFGAPIIFGEETPTPRYTMAKVFPHITESRVDCIQSEGANTDGRYLEQDLKSWKEFLSDKDYAVGAVTPYDLLETVEDVSKIIDISLKYVPPEKLALSSDEGLWGNQFLNRMGATTKMKLLVAAANKARKKLSRMK